jgi:hypothetical protein
MFFAFRNYPVAKGDCHSAGIFFNFEHCARAEKDPALRDDMQEAG